MRDVPSAAQTRVRAERQIDKIENVAAGLLAVGMVLVFLGLLTYPIWSESVLEFLKWFGLAMLGAASVWLATLVTRNILIRRVVSKASR